MLRSQTIHPVRASVKNTSCIASSTGRVRTSQRSPPSEVESSAPLPPTAHPRDSSTKKTECSQANVPVCCRRHAAAWAEGRRQKAKSKRQKVKTEDRAALVFNFLLLPFAFCLLPFMLPAAGEDAREAEDGRELEDGLDLLPAVAGDEDLIAGAQEVVVGGFALAYGG